VDCAPNAEADWAPKAGVDCAPKAGADWAPKRPAVDCGAPKVVDCWAPKAEAVLEAKRLFCCGWPNRELLCAGCCCCAPKTGLEAGGLVMGASPPRSLWE